MAFQFTDQGPQYHEPVAPVTPTVHPLPPAPEQIGASIVHAFVSRAIAAEQAQVDQQRMMQTADLQAQHLAYQDKWQTEDHAIAQQNADSMDRYRQKETDWHLQNKTERDNAIAAKQEAKQAGEAMIHGIVQSADKLDKESLTQATPLLDQQTILNRPGYVLKGIGYWKGQFGGAKIGATPEVEKQLDTVASSLSVPLINGAQYVNTAGESTGPDLKWRVPGAADRKTGQTLWRDISSKDIVQTPLKDVANLYNDPVNRANIANGLIAAGHGSVSKDIKTIPWTIKKPFSRTGTSTTDTPTLDPWANKLLLDLGAKQLPTQSQVGAELRQPLKKWTAAAGLGQPPDATAGSSGPTQEEVDYVNAHNDPITRQRFLQAYPDSSDLLNP